MTALNTKNPLAPTQPPPEITNWMARFGIDAKTLKQAQKDQAKEEAAKIAGLLSDLKKLPGIDKQLGRFKDLSEAWEKGAEFLKDHSQKNEKSERSGKR